MERKGGAEGESLLGLDLGLGDRGKVVLDGVLDRHHVHLTVGQFTERTV